MGILGRFTDIMSANINAMLSKAEGANADKLLEKYIQDAKESLGQVKAETAAIIADEMAIARKISENDELQKKYEGYAMAAVQAGNDDDARKFLTHNQELLNKRADLACQYENAKQNSEKMRQMTSKLMADIDVYQGKLSELKIKLNIAKQQEQMSKINEKISQNPLGNADNLFDAVQKRIDTAEQLANLNSQANSKDAELAELEKKYASAGAPQLDSVEAQLARMKEALK